MTGLLDWKDKYNIGLDAIDQQHRSLFDTVRSYVGARSREEEKRNLMRVFRYTREHFVDEERLMRSVGFPGLARHIRLHEAFIDRFGTLVDQYAAREADKEALVAFFYEWIVAHIRREDMEISAFIRSRRQTVMGAEDSPA